jgi:glycosyltransferase involved in cell wall biosynthesis
MNRETAAEGHGNDFKSFAFSIYKIAYDYTKSSPKAGSRAKDLLSMFNSLVFERGAMPLRERFMLNRLKNTASEKDRILFEFISRISADLTEDKNIPFEKKFDRIYENIAALVDNFFVLIAHSLSAHAKNNEPAEMFKNMFSAIPVFFLSAPFFSSMKQLSKERAILMRLLLSENGKQKYTRSKTLWFTDTIHDLNGVSVSLRRLIKTAHEHNREVALAVCTGNALAAELPEQTLDFPCIFEHTPDFYASYTLRFPSLLRALDAIDRFHPDRIVVSTPGPVGWKGILAARLLGIPCVCVYHTDFALQSQLITGDESLTDSVRMYTRFFYSFADEIRVPSRAYFSKLADDGYAAHKLKLFARGIDDSFVATPVNEKAAFTIVWAGRISHDKNIAFLLDLFREIRTRDRRTKLLIAGDGPALSHFAHEAESIGGVAFLGRIPADDLPTFYRSGDLMLFPSIMDTFGMSVLEAQACGIPCIVTDKGGPCEIVENGITGHVLPLADKQAWLHAAETYALERNCDIENYNKNKLYISERIRARFGWEAALRDILDNPVNTDERTSL